MKIFVVLSQGIKHCVKSVQIQSYFWCAFSCTRTEYGDLLRISPYSIRVQENTDLKKLPIWTLFKQWNNTINDWSEGRVFQVELECISSWHVFIRHFRKIGKKRYTSFGRISIPWTSSPPKCIFARTCPKK